jgi:peptidoglycan hydrolase CwlO-like protein
MSKKQKTVYCGVDKLKENQRLGTAKECAELKQVRYYGLKKVSKKIIDDNKGMPVQAEKRLSKLSKKRGGLRGKIMKIKDEIEDYKNEEDYRKNQSYQKAVKKLEDEMKKLKEELSKVTMKIKDLSKK